jgi:hypothetical protein
MLDVFRKLGPGFEELDAATSICDSAAMFLRIERMSSDAIVALSAAGEYQAAEYVRPWRRSREL